MERLQPRATVGAPVIALALAAAAAALFGVGDTVGFLSDAAEGLFVLTWLAGWALLIWAALIAGGFAVSLGRRSFSRRPVYRAEVALALAAVALTALVVAIHPLWGTGSAVG